MSHDILRTSKRLFLASSAAGILLAAQGVIAGEEGHDYQSKTGTANEQQADHAGQHAMQQMPGFGETDLNKDQRAQIEEIQSSLGELLAEVDWREADLLAKFDKDNDQALDQQEFDNLQNTLYQSLARLEPGEGQQGQTEQYEEQAQLEQDQQEFDQQQQSSPDTQEDQQYQSE
ncbi:hypothetical protein F6455_06765 [Proteobacteria bacterium 005FR1]|nr:hypothetical protein [Proteobacteria bacterium 005FR1]